MNRRESLRALAISSIGAAVPAPAWSEKTRGVSDGKIAGGTDAAFPAVAAQHYKADFFLVSEKSFLGSIRTHLDNSIKIIDKDQGDMQALVAALAGGASMLWIGSATGIPKELSIGSFAVSSARVQIRPASTSPVAIDDLDFSAAVVQSAYLSPPKEMPLHNIDEEVRADFLPLLESYDQFGNLCGYPAVLMSYYAPSLAGGRFKGSECFCFFTDEPLQMCGIATWKNLIDKITRRGQSGLQVNNFTTGYSSYITGERVQAVANIENRRNEAVWAVLKFYIQPPTETTYKLITETRRVAGGRSETQAICDFLPATKEKGLWKMRLEIWQDVAHGEKLAHSGGELQLVDRRDIGFMLLPTQLSTPVNFSFEGPEIVIDNQKGFWAGTHYYPSTSWWEWLWRDFRPLKAAEDFAAMRRAGYRIVRIWIDPILDEPVLRAMDAAIQLASDQGIVLDICVFTQWVRYIGFERSSGEQVNFEFRHPDDFNIVSFSLRNMDLQREYIQVLGARWKSAGNIFYNIANEVFVKDPDDSQMDAEVGRWPENRLPAGTKRDTALFQRWSWEMTLALKKCGANQPAMPGYMFSTMNGGDVYMGNEHSPVIPWHSYLPTKQTASTIQYFDPISSGKPLLLEEFGRLGWNNVQVYDEHVHYALAAGAAAAMSYEWGISWLCRESCYWPIPLLEACVENPDPRWFKPYTMLKETWSENGVGLCATPSGTGYGSVYHGTPFTAEAAAALGRLGLMGQGLQRGVYAEKVYLLIPEAKTQSLEIIQPLLKDLWQAKLIFGIWQEKDLASLPKKTRALICPVPVSTDLDYLRNRGVHIFEGTTSWRSCTDFEKIATRGADNMDLIARRTATGLLCTIVNRSAQKTITMGYSSLTVQLSIENFAMVHFSNNRVSLVEGTGKITVNNETWCQIDNGRAIIAVDSGTLKLMVTRPAKIRFRQKISSVSISDGLADKPRPVDYAVKGQVLDIDDQLAKYVIHVKLK